MPTLEETTLWTAEDVATQIKLILPVGWSVTYEGSSGKPYDGLIKDENSLPVWSGSSTDRRLLLFDVYGWLLVRRRKGSNPFWVRSGTPTPKPVVGVVSLDGVSVPDPEDLDLDEIQSVLKAAGG